MPSSRRHNSTGHQLHVCMSQQIQTCLCIADGLFISTVATLLHSYCTVRKMSYSACISLMFSRWRDFFDAHSYSTSKRQSMSPSIWMTTSNHRWRLELLQAMWCLMNYSGSLKLNSSTLCRKMKCTNLVNRVVPCQCTLDGIYALRVRTLKCI